MKSIRVIYPNLQNAGDLFNETILEMIFNLRPVRSKVYNADLSALGGALSGVQYAQSPSRRATQAALGALYAGKPLHVWGSGFLLPNNPRGFCRRLQIHALRGELSRQKLQTLLNKPVSVPLADPGLLAGLVINKKIEKTAQLGIIPHFSQRGDENFAKLSNKYPQALIIDITAPPLQAIKAIAACETVLSGSLHGLIFAHSLHIPALAVTGQKSLLGGDFKFRDYYSSFGLSCAPWNLSYSLPNINQLTDGYKIQKADVEEKQNLLLSSFPFQSERK